IGTLLWATNKFLPHSLTQQRVSRRELLDKSLKVALKTTILGSLLRYPLPYVTTLASNEQTEEFLQTVANVLRTRIVRSTFLDGRTALLLAKADDAQAALSSSLPTENVVVMGSAHVDMAPTYMQNKQERNTAIAAYAQELLDTGKQ